MRPLTKSPSAGTVIPSVLVIEPEVDAAGVVVRGIRGMGFPVTYVSTPPDAIAALEQRRFVVVVLGEVSGKNGAIEDLLSEIRARQPACRIILMFTEASAGTNVAMLRAGAYDSVAKPVNVELLVEKVHRAAQSALQEVTSARLVRDYQQLLDTIPGLAVFVDPQGTFTRVNRAGTEMLGYHPSELEGESYRTVIAPEEDTQITEWLFRNRRTGNRAAVRQRVALHTHEAGRRIFELSTTGAWDDSGLKPQFLGTLVVGWDVTEQVELEQQLRHSSKMEAIGRLAGAIVHDFNNLLMVIAASGPFVRSHLDASSPAVQAVRDMEWAGRRATDLTRQLLSFSRQRLRRPKVLAIDTVVEANARILERVLGESVVVDVELDAAELKVRTDPGQIDQIIMNLAVNARDAMPDGGRLTIATSKALVEAPLRVTRPELPPGEYVRVEFRDSGLGMLPDMIERIFEPFFTTKDGDGGTGLGLAVVYGIVTQNGGAIRVQSAPGKGSVFSVYLPVAEGVAERTETGLRSARPRLGTVLVVDDEPIVRRVLIRSLESQGFTVREAGDGQEALDLVERDSLQVDVLVTDLVMPRMGGAELARRLRSAQPLVRVIYMSGYAEESDREPELLDRGALFIDKPVTAGQFLDALRDVTNEVSM